VVRERTAKNRFSWALKSTAEWCCRHRHTPLDEQQKAPGLKMRGHYGYYDRLGKRARLDAFHAGVSFIWKKWLGRRSQRRLYWKGMYRLLRRFRLPKPARRRLRPA
jgi:hypothetical protein